MKKAILPFIVVFLWGLSIATAAETLQFEEVALQDVKARYRLFRTQNIWTYIELDTKTGRIWQVTFAVDADAGYGRFTINEQVLVKPDASRDGRFTLYPTHNMWTFILVDQDDGRTWQVQYSMTGNSFIRSLPERRLLPPSQ